MPALSAEAWHGAAAMLVEVDERGAIVAANDRFLAGTGYSAEEAAGMRLARFLTAAGRLYFEAQLQPMLTLNGRLEEVLLDIVGRDGSRTPALMNAVRAGDGGAQFALMAVPDRSRYEEQLRAARQLAEHAARESDRRLRRLTVVARANAALARSLDIRAALQDLADALVGNIAQWAVVYAPDETAEHGRRWFSASDEPARAQQVKAIAALIAAAQPGQPGSIGNVLAGRQRGPLSIAGAQQLQAALPDRVLRDAVDSLQVGSLLVLPSRARGRQTAVLILARASDQPPFSEGDLADLTDLADRTGIAIDNLRLYQREHDASMALQRAMMTDPPDHPGVRIAVRYRPAAASNEVGGDWYDAFHDPDGALVLAIGDVMGHDIRAAAAMGQLRGIIRTIGHTIGGTPAEILARADRAAHGLGVDAMASAIALQVRVTGGVGPVQVLWSNAGHPPPIHIDRAGKARALQPGSDIILGVLPDDPRRDYRTELLPGETLVLYTDGLVERRGASISDGIDRLAAALADGSALSPDGICDRAFSIAPERGEDDIALLVLRIEP